MGIGVLGQEEADPLVRAALDSGVSRRRRRDRGPRARAA